MKVAVGVMSYNIIAGLRTELTGQTVRSIGEVFPGCEVYLLDNSSSDGTLDILDGLAAELPAARTKGYESADGNHTPGRGRNVLLDWMLTESDAEVFVWSDDDMLWKPGALDKLVTIWSDPAIGEEHWWGTQIAIVGGLLEPEWLWNTPRCTVDTKGGVSVLVRDSAPGAAWSFRARRTADDPVGSGMKSPVWSPGLQPSTPGQPQGPFKHDFGYDYDFCRRLSEDGLLVAQLDLADHLGWEASTHGNRAIDSAKPLDRKKWRV